jgi:hypothetical protein
VIDVEGATPPWPAGSARLVCIHAPSRFSISAAPIILTVDAAAMRAANHAFYQAANGVWLTDHVPAGYLSGWPG